MLAPQRSDPPRQVAVILNGRARGVSPGVVRRVGRLVGSKNLYVSRTLDDSQDIAAEVVSRRYDAVLLGGGDGTFVQCLSDLQAQASERGLAVPRLGILRLGTGNALAWALGASPPTVEGLRRDLDRASFAPSAHLPLLEVDGRLTPFAGVGLDAQILDDFAATTRFLDRLGVGRSLGSGLRYGLAVAFRSTPRFVATRRPEVVAINRGSPAYRVGRGGRLIGDPVPAGEVLFRGRCSLAAGATIPYYGLGLKMFPYSALAPGRLQLRCATASAAEIVAHLPSVWRGDYESATVGDFLVDRVELRLDRPVPMQIGGDLQPAPRDQLVLALAPRAVPIVH